MIRDISSELLMRLSIQVAHFGAKIRPLFVQSGQPDDAAPPDEPPPPEDPAPPDANLSGEEGEMIEVQVEVWQAALAVGLLLAVVIGILAIAWRRSWKWDDPNGLGGRLRALALPNGTVRSVLAISIIFGFIIFAFFGSEFLQSEDRFTGILGGWLALTGAVSGFYFGARTGQPAPATTTSADATGLTYSIGEDDPPAAPAPDGSVCLTRESSKAYLRKGGAWQDLGVSLPVEPLSLTPERGVDLNSSPPLVNSAQDVGAYIVAEDAAAANYRLAHYNDSSAAWVWVGASITKA